MIVTESRSLWARHHYAAFISYARADKLVGDRFQRGIERYTIPKPLISRDTLHGPVPKRLTPIFRDITDLSAAGDLGSQIDAALSQSAFLIVLCSPRSAASRWVNNEIESFKRMGGGERIIPVILEGDPVEFDAEAAPNGAFPRALMRVMGADGQLTDEHAPEPMAPDLREGAEGFSYAVLKAVAAMIGLAPDIVSQRQAEVERRERRMVRRVAAAVTVLAVAASAAAVAAYSQMISARVSESRAFAGLAWNAIGQGEFDRAIRLGLQAAPAGEGILVSASSADADEAVVAAMWGNRTLARILPSVNSDEHQIEHIELSADKSTAAVVGAVGGIRVLNTATGQVRLSVPWAGRIQETDEMTVYSAALNPDGSRLITFRLDAFGQQFDEVACGLEIDSENFEDPWTTALSVIWDIERGCPIAHLGSLLDSGIVPGGAVWSPDGGAIITLTWLNRQATVWDAETMTERFRFSAAPDALSHSVEGSQEPPPVFTRDGSKILSKTGAGEVTLFDALSGESLRTYAMPALPDADTGFDITGAMLIETEGLVAIEQWERPPVYFDLETAEPVAAPDRPVIVQRYEDDGDYNYTPRVIAFPPGEEETPAWKVDAQRFAVLPEGDAVITFTGARGAMRDIQTGAERLSFVGHTAPVNAMMVLDSPRVMLTGSEDGEIRMWDIGRRSPVSEAVESGDIVAIGGQAHALDVDRVRLSPVGAVPDMPPLTFEGPVEAIEASPDGARIVALSDDGRAIVRDSASGAVIGEIGNIRRLARPAFSAAGDRVGLIDMDGRGVIATAAGDVLMAAEQDSEWQQAAIAPDGLMLVGMTSRMVFGIDAASGQSKWAFRGFIYPDRYAVDELEDAQPELLARDIVASPDGARLLVHYDASPRVVYEADHGVLLDMKTGATISDLPFGLFETLEQAQFSPDGAILVTTGQAVSSSAPDMRMWDARDGRLLAIVEDFGNVVAFGISPSSERVVAATETSMGVWGARSGRRIADLSEEMRTIGTIAQVLPLDGKVVVRGESRQLYSLSSPPEHKGRDLAVRACAIAKTAGIQTYSREELASVDIAADRLAPCDRVGLLSPRFVTQLFDGLWGG